MGFFPAYNIKTHQLSKQFYYEVNGKCISLNSIHYIILKRHKTCSTSFFFTYLLQTTTFSTNNLQESTSALVFLNKMFILTHGV